MTTITRVGHCSECYKADRPKTGQHYLVFCGSMNKYKSLIAKRNGKRGFTPHIYVLIKVESGKVIYKKICAMEGCGAQLIDETFFVRLDETKWVTKTMTIADWNCLVQFKDQELMI